MRGGHSRARGRVSLVIILGTSLLFGLLSAAPASADDPPPSLASWTFHVETTYTQTGPDGYDWRAESTYDDFSADSFVLIWESTINRTTPSNCPFQEGTVVHTTVSGTGSGSGEMEGSSGGFPSDYGLDPQADYVRLLPGGAGQTAWTGNVETCAGENLPVEGAESPYTNTVFLPGTVEELADLPTGTVLADDYAWVQTDSGYTTTHAVSYVARKGPWTDDPACDDGLDNDADGRVDAGMDPGCTNAEDTSEKGAPVCDNGIDDDEDEYTDFKIGADTDPECDDPADEDEAPVLGVCEDGVDNDDDGRSDYGADPGCDSTVDISELSEAECDNGFDDDGDGVIDYRLTDGDPGCDDLEDLTENCDGVQMDEVAGIRPDWLDGKELSDFPNDDAMCEALWVPNASGGFVPQGLALAGDSAWISGYVVTNPTAPEKKQKERCQLEQISLDTGARLRILRGIQDKNSERVWCKHGGGTALTRHGLWVVDTRNLWLLNPAKIGQSNPVEHRWPLANDRGESLKGSFLLAGNSRELGIGQFEDKRAGRILMFRYADLLRSSGKELAGVGPASRRQLAPSGKVEAVRRAQGAAYGPAAAPGVYASSSTASCGFLIRNGSTRFGFGPGVEEIEFNGEGVWAVFESSAQKFQEKGRPVTPMLARFDTNELFGEDSEAEDCEW